MARSRYTYNDLQSDLTNINVIGKENRGGKTYLVAQSRNGYVGLDEYSVDTNRCVRTIQCGTAKECLTSALEWAI